ncbi:MAG: hypothetical protein GY941_28495, partial [Planctomycetes bacterium]|nr:hypothetical protein [Planctomycetota bacterium]
MSGNTYNVKQLEDSLLSEIQPRVSVQTLHDYTVILNGVTNHLKHAHLTTVRREFNDYIHKRQEAGISTRTLNLTIELTKRMFLHAIETGLIAADPLSGLRKLKNAKKVKRALLPDEVKALLKNSGKRRILWLTFLNTGLRRT